MLLSHRKIFSRDDRDSLSLKPKLAIRHGSGFRLHCSLAPRLNIHCNERRASDRDQPLLIVGNADIDDANRSPDFDGRRDSNKFGT